VLLLVCWAADLLQITSELAAKAGCCPTGSEGVGSLQDFETGIDECQQTPWAAAAGRRAHIHFLRC
jgi:hypothetical protein